MADNSVSLNEISHHK